MSALASTLKPTFRVSATEFRFTEDGWPLAASSPQSLAKKLREFRTVNHRPPGDPEMEVLVMMAKEHPEMLRSTRLPASQTGDGTPEGLGVRVGAWLASKANPAPTFSPHAHTLDRTKVCAACPRNVPVDWPQMTKDLLMATRGASARADNLAACACWQHHNKLAVLLDEYAREKTEAQGEVPQNCWVKLTNGKK